MFKCFICGEDGCIWGSDFTFDDLGFDGDGIVSYFTCPNCNAEYEVRQPYEEEEA